MLQAESDADARRDQGADDEDRHQAIRPLHHLQPTLRLTARFETQQDIFAVGAGYLDIAERNRRTETR